MEGLALTVPATKRVRKAVITAAGHGTRLFPMTKIIRKEFMPVLDGAGRMVPLIVAHILDAVAAGIEEIALIIQPDEESTFRRLLHEPVSPEVFGKLSRENQERAREIEAAGARVTLLPQPEQHGLGHAVLSAREWIGDEPFLLVLGDHYFVSGGATGATLGDNAGGARAIPAPGTREAGVLAGGRGARALQAGEPTASAAHAPSCYRQIVDAYARLEGALIGLAETPESEIGRFGTVTGEWEGCADTGAADGVAERPAGGGGEPSGTAADRTGSAVPGGEVRGDARPAGASDVDGDPACGVPTLAISALVEKPSVDYAREYLRVDGLDEDRYLTVFGLYILPSQLLRILAEAEAAGDYDRGELQLTSALDRLRAEAGMRGVAIDGRKVDIGVPEEFAGIW
jgi:UTP-glucose-1-phosphate uridylyltransferase